MDTSLTNISDGPFHSMDRQLQNLLTEYACKNVDDRIKISNTNTILQNYFSSHRSIVHFPVHPFRDHIFQEDFLTKQLRYADYDAVYIRHNPTAQFKNHIWVHESVTTPLDEIVLNTNYTIVTDSPAIDYKYKIPTSDVSIPASIATSIATSIAVSIDNVEYILYGTPEENTEKMSDFLRKRCLLFRICIPSFSVLPARLLSHIENTYSDRCWEIRLDQPLCEKYIQDNFHVFLYYCYSLIYSVTSRTDLIRHMLLFKHGGSYLDISVKVLSTDFFDLMSRHDFMTSKEQNTHDGFQPGILYLQQRQSMLCKKFLLEVLSGVFNESAHENDSKSFLYDKQPSLHSFFYGPNTLYRVYEDICQQRQQQRQQPEIQDEIQDETHDETHDETQDETQDDMLCPNILENKIIRTDTHVQPNEFESYCIYSHSNQTMLQVKYIGYYQDMYTSTKNDHYTTNYNKSLYFHSAFNMFDKILVIHLAHRIDRRAEIENELNQFVLEKNKVVFIDAVYNPEDGALGCIMSHEKCIQYAMEHNLSSVLILEDDCCFENIDILNISLTRFLMSDIPWDVLLFGFSEYGPPVSVKTNVPGLYQNVWSQSAGAYAIHRSFYQTQLDNIRRNIHGASGPYDFYWNENRTRQKWFIIKNTLGYQRPSYSDIENRFVDYKLCYDSFLYI